MEKRKKIHCGIGLLLLLAGAAVLLAGRFQGHERELPALDLFAVTGAVPQRIRHHKKTPLFRGIPEGRCCFYGIISAMCRGRGI